MEAAAAPILRIRPRSGWASIELGEIFAFRDLLWTLAGRDIKLRYRQTALGVAWVVLQPLLSSFILTIVFGYIAGFAKDKSYFALVFAGQLAWQAFSTTVTRASTSMLTNSNLVSKVYFPRLVLPISTIFSTLIDFAVGLVMMAVLMAIFHIVPGWQIVMLPVWLLLLLMLSMGIGLIAGALSVTYRDVQYILPVLVQALMFASPVAYPARQAPHWLQNWFFLNPLASMIEAFRWSLLNNGEMRPNYLIYSAGLTMIVFVIGIACFSRMERTFADVI